MVQKTIGDYRLSLLYRNSSASVGKMTVWSMRLNKQLYSTGMMTRARLTSHFNKLNSKTAIESYLKNKIRLSDKPNRMNW